MSENKDKWCWTRIAEASQRNKNDTCKCLGEILQIILDAGLVFVFFVFENLIGILFLLLGIIFMNDCPIRDTIPISLITFGAFSLIHGITMQLIRYKCCNLSDERDGFATLSKIVLLISSLGTFVAFIWACIEIYGVFSDVTTHRSHSSYYCNFYLYWTAFVFITICLALFLIFLLVFCCLLCSVICGGAALSTLQPTFVIIKGSNN